MTDGTRRSIDEQGRDDTRRQENTRDDTSQDDMKGTEAIRVGPNRYKTDRDDPRRAKSQQQKNCGIDFFAFVVAYLFFAYNGGEFYSYVKDQMSVALV